MLIFTTSCSKDRIDDSLIEGDWQVISRSNGDFSPSDTIDLTEFEFQYHFTQTHFTYSKKDEILAEGTYTLVLNKKNQYILSLHDELHDLMTYYIYAKESKNVSYLTESASHLTTKLHRK